MDIFFPITSRERDTFKESAVKCGFVELTAETTANVGILPADERIPILLMAWENIANFLTKNTYNQEVGVTVSWVCRCTLNLWFGREWITCTIESKTNLIEQMMKVYPTAFIAMHPYSWPYMFSIYRDPWMVEYLNSNFQRMSGPDLTPILEAKDSEFIQQEGIPLLILRMVNMFDFRMVKLVKYICLRLLLTWQDQNSIASTALRASPNADQYVDYARHIYMISICENNGLKDLHYSLETIQRMLHCNLTETWSLEVGAQVIAKGLQESNKSLTEFLVSFLFKVSPVQFDNIFGMALNKYIHFITEYQLRNINRIKSCNLPWSTEEVYSRLVHLFIAQRESSENLIKMTSKLSEKIFLELNNLTASKCAYELIKKRPHPEWDSTKITLLLTIISEEINIIQDCKYNDVQSTDELIEKEKEVAVYYRDLAKLFHKSPYLEQEAWLTTFSLHPCREFMDAVIRCGARNLRAIKKQAHKLKVIDIPAFKTSSRSSNTANITKEGKIIMDNNTCNDIAEVCAEQTYIFGDQLQIKEITKKKTPHKKADKIEAKRIEPKVKEKPQDETVSTKESQNGDTILKPSKRGRPLGARNKETKIRPTSTPRKTDEKLDLAEEIFAAAAGAAENINIQTVEMIKYPAFALMNSVTDTEELMKFTNYEKAYEQYTELTKIFKSIKLGHAFHDDLLTLLIAPRYKRLTWAISWKKLKKRCRIMLTKENKKRELVEQSMADANDRLTHLNIDYEKYKHKPQIDYGTIEGGYECYDTDSDDDDTNSKEMDVHKRTINQVVSANNDQTQKIDAKPFLKVENLDSSSSNLLNIIESTHLSKPVYLNKPVYFVRNALTNPKVETTISLEAEPINESFSIFSSSEETLSSDSFIEHKPQCTNSVTPSEFEEHSKKQNSCISNFKLNCGFSSAFKSEKKFNIPASIRQQLEQPSMFFKPQTESNAEIQKNTNKCSYLNHERTDKSEAINFATAKPEIFNHTLNPDQLGTVLSENSRFSPKLFEDIPEDLTLTKSAISDQVQVNKSTQNVSPGCVSTLIEDSRGKKFSIVDSVPEQTVKCNIKREQTQENGVDLHKIMPFQKLKEEESIVSPNCKISRSTELSSKLKSVRILPHNKKSVAMRINQTAAVVFSSAAASYHRTPFLNKSQQEPNILQQLLSNETKPFSSVDKILDETLAIDNEQSYGAEMYKEKTVPVTTDSKSATQEVPNPSVFIDEHQHSLPKNVHCQNEKNTLSIVKEGTYQSLFDGEMVTNRNSKDINNSKVVTSVANNEHFSAMNSENSDLVKDNLNNLDSAANSFSLLGQGENSGELNSSHCAKEFKFKVPAAVAKPCFFMRSKRMIHKSNASDWVHNIIFNNKTAEIILPHKRIQNICPPTKPKSNDETNSKSRSSQSLQNQPGDILHDNGIVLNEKLLDPHLRTYKNTKAPCKPGDNKKLEKSSEKNESLTGIKSNDLKLLDVGIVGVRSTLLNPQPNKKTSSPKGFILNCSSEKSISIANNNLPGLVTTNQPSILTPSIQKSGKSIPTKKKRFRPTIPSTKKFDKSFEWINMAISTSREENPKLADTSSALFNLFSAQMMNKAKSIHFNYEYLQEIEKLKLRSSSNEKGIDCEASILIANPEPSADGVKLIKAFKKNTVHKGLDLSSNEVSFTSFLAKEVLGTVIKVTLNESASHTSCDGNHFDASDVLDQFTNSRRNVKSPTFYSPTLSTKHLRNGTLSDSVEYVDTSLENLIPKPGRKRISKQTYVEDKKKYKLNTNLDNEISSLSCQISSDVANKIPLNENVLPNNNMLDENIDVMNSVNETQSMPSTDGSSEILLPEHKGKIENMSVLKETLLEGINLASEHRKVFIKNAPLLEESSLKENAFGLHISSNMIVNSNFQNAQENTLYENKNFEVDESEQKSLTDESTTTCKLDVKYQLNDTPENLDKEQYFSESKQHTKERNNEKTKQSISEELLTNNYISKCSDESETVRQYEIKEVLLEEAKDTAYTNEFKARNLEVEEDKHCWAIETENHESSIPKETDKNIVPEETEKLNSSETIELPSGLDVENTVKKRIAKPRISYAEFDSDSDEQLKNRLKAPSIKIDYPSIRAARRKLLKSKLLQKQKNSKKLSARRPSKRIQKLTKERRRTAHLPKTYPSSCLNDFDDDDDDKPLVPTIRSPLDNRTTRSTRISNDSEEDIPLKKISLKQSSQQPAISFVSSVTAKRNQSNLLLRKRDRNKFSPKKPSIIKFSRRRTTTLNYFALFMSDSDEEEPIKQFKGRSTPDRLWTRRRVRRKTVKLTEKNKVSLENKLRHNRTTLSQNVCASKTSITKPKNQITEKMPVLVREDSDPTDEENIYECATMSTANETDEEACSDYRLRKRRQKVVKPMRIRCVSRRPIHNDVESSSCSSNTTTQTTQEIINTSSSFVGFSKRGRLLRTKTLEKNLFMSTLVHESSSSSSPIMMNTRTRQFAAKSTSKPMDFEQFKTRDEGRQLTCLEKEAIQNHNCVNFQIRLQRLTADEANLCRKPYIRLDKNFVDNYIAEKLLNGNQ